MVSRLAFLAILPVAFSSQAASVVDEREAGLPFLRNYSPREYSAQAQNWAIAQDSHGVMYFGNNDGVVVYDGVKWQTIRITNRTAVRSLAVDRNDTVFVGAGGEFGYLAADDAGALRYISLLAKVPGEDRKFKDVWRTIATPKGVFFSSFERLFRWKPGEGLKTWKPARRFHWAFASGSELYIQHPGPGGLLRLDSSDALQPVSGGEQFSNDRVYCISTHGGKLLVAAAAGGMYLQDGGAFVSFPTEADGLLRQSQPYSCEALPGGGWAIATLRSGVVLLSAEGKVLRLLNRSSGLFSDTATYAFADGENGLWLAFESGLARVQAPSPLTHFDERTGLKGATRTLTRHRDLLYAGTTTGVYRLVPSTTGESARFEPIEGIHDSVRTLLSTESGLLAGSSTGVYRLEGGRFRLLRESQVIYDLIRSSRNPELIYATGRSGLTLLRHSGGRWVDGGKAAGIRQTLRRPVEVADGLWIGSDFEGVIRVNDSTDPPGVTSFGSKEGLPSGSVYPALVGGRVVFLSEEGILLFDERTRRFSPDTAVSPLFAETLDKPLLMIEDDRGNLWAGAKTYGGLLRKQANGRYQWDNRPLRRMAVTEIYSANIDPTGVVWAGTAEGIVRYNPAIPKDYGARFRALVRQVRDTGAGKIHFSGAGDPKQPRLPYKDNSLRFEFAAPSFEEEARTQYRVYLEGFDRGWSAWAPEPRKEYTNLPEDNYRFRVQAMNLYGVTSEEGVYRLTVLAPWYRSWWGYGIQLLAVAIAIGLIVRWRLRILAAQNRRLQKIVEQRTAELRENNEKLSEVNASLSLLNNEKNEFMGIAAHDLKNPLGAIRGYAEMLEEDAGEIAKDEVADTAARIKKSANLMFDLVSNLLDVNRIEQGKMDAKLEPCDLWDAMRQAADGYRLPAASKKIRLHFDERTRAPLALADATQLTQIVDNLVSNAVKYSPSGKNIYLTVREMEGSVRAEVRDEGPGISAEDQKRLFGKFARLSAKPTAGEHSTGLGLAIVKKLVESMHGKVWCESELGQGATFILQLPSAGERMRNPAAAASSSH